MGRVFTLAPFCVGFVFDCVRCYLAWLPRLAAAAFHPLQTLVGPS